MGFLNWVRGVNERLEPAGDPAVAPVPTEADIIQALTRTEQLAREARLNPVVISRVTRVSGIIRQTLPRMKTLGPGSLDAYAVVATATDYLPEALSAYLRLPRDWADSRPIENGKTSLMLLIDQLDLLGATMDKIFDAICRSDANALIAHGRFLQQRFGHEANGAALAAGQPSEETRQPPEETPSPRNPLDLE